MDEVRMASATHAEHETKDVSVAVAIPCYNEALTIARVVHGFQAVLPQAAIHVFDNNSRDGSAALAADAGASIHRVPKQGKGHVMRAIFDTIVADVVLVVDGDDTYLPEEAPLLLQPILREEADMVVGNRLQSATDESLRQLHQIGNRLIVALVNLMFGQNFRDILSGYRAFNRNFVQSVPLLTSGFETETELTLRALNEGLAIVEVPISYRRRPAGSHSKLRSFRDGYRITMTAVILLRDLYPLRLFGLTGLACLLVALIAGILTIISYGGMSSLPTVLLAGIVLLFALLGLLSVGIGLILNAISSGFRQTAQIIKRTGSANDRWR